MTNGDWDDDDLPDVRPIPAVRRDMLEIVGRCAAGMDDAQMATTLERALSLMLEIRVPRMPGSAEELRLMLVHDEDDDLAMSTDEVFTRLERHRQEFALYMETYREGIAQGDWLATARMLMPATSARGVQWGGGTYVLEIVSNNNAIITRTEGAKSRLVESRGKGRGAAALAAIMTAHCEWRGIWFR